MSEGPQPSRFVEGPDPREWIGASARPGGAAGGTPATEVERDDTIGATGRLDPKAGLAALFDAHAPRVLEHLALVLKDREAARDLTQEVFLRAHRAPEPFRPGMRYRAWLITIASRLALNHLRDIRRKRTAPGELLDALPDRGASDPQARALESQGLGNLTGAIGGLPPRYRQILILKYLEELPVDEIGRVLDLPRATVLTRLYRGRLILRRRLDHGVP